MDIVKTICPGCFKTFDAAEILEKVYCNFCGHSYDLPKLRPKISLEITSKESE